MISIMTTYTQCYKNKSALTQFYKLQISSLEYKLESNSKKLYYAQGVSRNPQFSATLFL